MHSTYVAYKVFQSLKFPEELCMQQVTVLIPIHNEEKALQISFFCHFFPNVI